MSKAASKLTCLEGIDLQEKPYSDFAYYNINNKKLGHVDKQVIIQELEKVFTMKSKILEKSSNEPEILSCQAQISRRYLRICQKQDTKMIIRNEGTVCYMYGDPNVDLLI